MTGPIPDERRRRRRLLAVVLAATRLPFGPEGPPAVITALRRWLDSWTGIGRIAVGMARQGYDLQLTRYADAGWRATFYVSGMEHSATSAIGSAWEPTPWRAVQAAAWDVLRTTRD